MLQSRAPLQMAGGGVRGERGPRKGVCGPALAPWQLSEGAAGSLTSQVQSRAGVFVRASTVSSLWAQGTVPATLSRRMNEGRKERGRMNE